MCSREAPKWDDHATGAPVGWSQRVGFSEGTKVFRDRLYVDLAETEEFCMKCLQPHQSWGHWMNFGV